MLRAHNTEKSNNLFEKARTKFQEFSAENPGYTFTHADYNAGNSFSADNEHCKAAECYFRVLNASILKEVDTEKCIESEASSETLHFNSQSCYAHTWSNLAVIFLLLSIRQAKGFGENVGTKEEATQAAKTCIG